MNIDRNINVLLVAPQWSGTQDQNHAELEKAHAALEQMGFGQGEHYIFSRHEAQKTNPGLTGIEILATGLYALCGQVQALIGIGNFGTAVDTKAFVAVARAAGVPVFRLFHETRTLQLIADGEEELRAADSVRVPDESAEQHEQRRLEDEISVMEIQFAPEAEHLKGEDGNEQE